MKRKSLGLLGLIVGFLSIGINGFAADGDLIVNGNVGIGTSNPNYSLHVAGSTGFRVQVGDNSVIKTRISANDLSAFDGSNNPSILYLNYDGGIVSLVPNGSGNVGIGTAGPGRKLEVDFSNTDDGGGIRLRNTASGGKMWGLTIAATGDINSVPAGSLYLREDSVGGVKFLVNPNGNVGIGTIDPGGYRLYVNGTAYSTGGWQSSDLRFKDNIKPIESPLDKILSIEGVAFDWKRDEFKDKGFPEGRHYGVIAQRVEKVLPEVVREGPGGEKSVSYTEIVPVLIEAIKEQQKEIERLKMEVTQFKTKN